MNDYDLRHGDRQVLDAFRDSESKFAFQGLKRRLGIHQETLSRALRRLEEDELVEHAEDGYRLTPRGSAIVKKNQKGQAQSYRMLETYLPPDVSALDVISRLKYSWFSTLRWFGYTQTEGGAVLTWLTEDGRLQIKARFQGNRLSIETDSNDEETSEISIKFAHELLARVVKEYQRGAAHLENSEFNN